MKFSTLIFLMVFASNIFASAPFERETPEARRECQKLMQTHHRAWITDLIDSLRHLHDHTLVPHDVEAHSASLLSAIFKIPEATAKATRNLHLNLTVVHDQLKIGSKTAPAQFEKSVFDLDDVEMISNFSSFAEHGMTHEPAYTVRGESFLFIPTVEMASGMRLGLALPMVGPMAHSVSSPYYEMMAVILRPCHRESLESSPVFIDRHENQYCLQQLAHFTSWDDDFEINENSENYESEDYDGPF